MTRPKSLSMVEMVFRGGSAGEPGCERDPGLSLMQDQLGSVTLADDQIAFDVHTRQGPIWSIRL